MALGEGMAKAIGKWLQNVSHPDNWYDFANPDPVKVTSALASPAVYKEVRGWMMRHSKFSKVLPCYPQVDQSRGIITFTNGDRFEGSFPSPDTRTGCLKGLDCETEATWINDHLDGLVCITDLNGKEIGHYKQGVRHGLVRYLRCKSTYNYSNHLISPQTVWTLCFKAGQFENDCIFQLWPSIRSRLEGTDWRSLLGELSQLHPITNLVQFDTFRLDHWMIMATFAVTKPCTSIQICTLPLLESLQRIDWVGITSDKLV